MAGGIATAIVTLSWLIGQRKPTQAKMSPYECGMAPVGDSRQRFSVKFYLVAMLFILFDVEAVFIYPWGHYLARFEALRAVGNAGIHRRFPGRLSSTCGKRASWTGAKLHRNEGTSSGPGPASPTWSS